MPKVSVLMPIYRTNESYLREAIESILNQSYTDYEFLILDDCPNDDREYIVKSYKDKRIKYFKNEMNLGISKSRNKLIDMAKGEYLAVMDHDDISLPDRFKEEVEFLDNNPDVGVVSCKAKYIVRNRPLCNPANDYDIKLKLMLGCSILHPASMIRKSVLIDNDIRYEEAFSPAEDYMLWCRLIKYTKFYNIQKILFHYRDHKTNTSHVQEDNMKIATYAILSSVKLDNPVLYNEFLCRAKKIIRFKLFGFIPFFRIVKFGNYSKFYLFEKILLLVKKEVMKL